jgi:serine/threonine protein kinase
LEKVGEGAFGTVHRAIYRHQEVAVKQLKNQIDQKEGKLLDKSNSHLLQLENFETEISMLSGLQLHANVAGEYCSLCCLH